MVKIIPLSLFDNQKVISINEEPISLSIAEDSCFLIATKGGELNILFIFFI